MPCRSHRMALPQAADGSACKANLKSMGITQNSLKLFLRRLSRRTSSSQASFCSLLQVRNKQVTKHFTEKTVKEIWKDRMAEHKSGKATDLCDFICNHFQKKIGIMSAVIEVFTSDIAESCQH